VVVMAGLEPAIDCV